MKAPEVVIVTVHVACAVALICTGEPRLALWLVIGWAGCGALWSARRAR